MQTEDISPINFSKAIGDRYLSYAMSTIMSRSLPDVRDGLKPVHRRLLYAMLQLKLDPKSGFKKCARVVGDVIGKYHPHGDTAVYDTMVRLAQDFAVRYPLVEGQGNFGSIDGDNAAAMRYTEARLTDVAIAILQDLDQNTVDFRPTYDGSDEEPIILPCNFPNLLANGSEGIAVGMATSIPPHNAGELCDALLHLIKSPNATIEKLTSFVSGPDFPTGGTIIDTQDTIVKNYKTGKGAFRVRAKWEKEDLGHGQYQIIITEIPYQVQKARLIEKIADLFKAKKLALLGNIRDESAEDIRIVLEPKSRTVDPVMLMESLFKLTELETRISLNMNVIAKNNVPKVLNLREVLQEFLDHRHVVLVRRSEYRLEKIERRLEILDGLLIAFLNLDEVIRIIREEEDPKNIMMKKWNLTEIQVEAILNTRLRSLRKLEETAIKDEHKKLSQERKELKALLKDETKRWAIISEEIKETKKKFGKKTELGKRRTDFTEAPEADVISIEAFVEKEPITILCSEKGWIKALKGHIEDTQDVKYKDGDKASFECKAYTTDKLIVAASNGRFYTIPCDKIPGGKGYGEPVKLMVNMEQDNEPISLFPYQEDKCYIVASNSGRGFTIKATDIITQTKNGKQILNLEAGAKALTCSEITGSHVAVIGTNRKLLIFAASEIPEMKKGRGLKLQAYRNGKLSDITTFNLEDGLTWQLGKKNRNETNLAAWIGHRGNAGRLPPTGFPRNNKFK